VGSLTYGLLEEDTATPTTNGKRALPNIAGG
jgi:hypothetical protein